jgi:hypothetical protein
MHMNQKDRLPEWGSFQRRVDRAAHAIFAGSVEIEAARRHNLPWQRYFGKGRIATAFKRMGIR